MLLRLFTFALLPVSSLFAAPSTVSAETELQLYLDHNPSGLGVLEFWEKNKALFPRLYAMTRKIFCAPASIAGVERLFSVAGYLLSNRRTNVTDSNFDKLLFGHVNFDLCDHVTRKRKALDD